MLVGFKSDSAMKHLVVLSGVVATNTICRQTVAIRRGGNYRTMHPSNVFIAAVALITATSNLLGFSAEGHKTIAAIATLRLSPRAELAVATILEGETLMEASIWPDEIKQPSGRLWKTDEARTFNREHKDNKKWHYVNFPVGAKRYSASSVFAYPHDIVHTINGCIDVLEGREYEGLNQKDALRWLVHLVGDIHQPLHVVAGFYDLSNPDKPKLESRTSEIDTATGDSGGNSLANGSSNMHSMWDRTLVDAIFATSNPAELAAHVMANVNPDSFKTSGSHKSWAAKWAGDSMKVAAQAYADIEFGPASLGAHGELTTIAVTLKPSTNAYRTKFAPISAEQLRKAGSHLAQLLNAIDWEGM
jgi:hypothetical protein